MEALRAFGEQTFASLRIRNYRLYLFGLNLSHIGDWMQTVALGWLVLDLTGSGVALGTVMALRFAPILALGLFVGGIIDRSEKRTLLFITQSSFGFFALMLGTLVYTGLIEMWMIYLLALLFGSIDAFDKPTRQTFVHETVGRDNLRNAVSLNSTSVNLARVVGPLFAGALIPTIGLALCFFLKAGSVVGILTLLARKKPTNFHKEESIVDEERNLLSGVRYAMSVPLIRSVLITMAAIGTLAYEFQVSLPLLARSTFGGGAADYAALLSAMGAGSVAGGLFAASRGKVSAYEFVLSAILFGSCILVTALLPTLSLAIVGMVFVGFFSITLSSTGNTMVQLESAPHMRGRVMALWMMAIFGSTLIGAPLIGWIGEHIGGRWCSSAGGMVVRVAVSFAAWRMLERSELLSIPAFIMIRRDEVAVEEDAKV